MNEKQFKLREKLEKSLLKDPTMAAKVQAEIARREESKGQETEKQYSESLLKTIDRSLERLKGDGVSPSDLMLKNTESIYMIAEALGTIIKTLENKNDQVETVKALVEMVSLLKGYTAKELPTPIVNVPAPIVKVEAPIIPEPKVLDQTKIVHETKFAEEANQILLKIAALVSQKQTSFKVSNEGPEEALPVKLVDAKGKNFYNAIMQAIASGGGGGTTNLNTPPTGAMYSNVAGDFTATADAGARTITLSSYASTILSGSISALNFLDAQVFRIASNGYVDKLPLTNITFLSDVLTLNDMASVFVAGDTVAVHIPGPVNDLRKKIRGEREDHDVMAVEHQFTPYNITAAATTIIMTTETAIHTLVINKTLTGTVTVYNSSTGSGSKIATYAVGTTPQSFEFDGLLANGLTIVTSAADDITANYRT